MKTVKVDRIDAQILKELSMLITYEIKDPRLDGAMISVVSVDTTKDLKYAKVVVTIMGSDKPKVVLSVLQGMSGFLRKQLAERMRVRAVPELTFILDTSYEYGLKIDKILDELHKAENKD